MMLGRSASEPYRFGKMIRFAPCGGAGSDDQVGPFRFRPKYDCETLRIVRAKARIVQFNLMSREQSHQHRPVGIKDRPGRVSWKPSLSSLPVERIDILVLFMTGTRQ